MRRLLALNLVAACTTGTPTQPAPPPPQPQPPAPHVDPAPPVNAPPPADAAPPVDAPPLARPSATVHLGLDLRALPRQPSPGQIDMYVLGQGDDLRKDAPGGVDVEVFHQPGIGSLTVVFHAATPADALAACKRAVATYLATAPQLPVIHQLAVQVLEPCAATK